MSDNTLHLRSAFLLEQTTIDRPKFLVKSGDYNWKIHRHLLYFHKQEQRLTRDRNTNEVTSIDPKSEDPWMVARLIQFLYTHNYDARYIESPSRVLGLEFSLEGVLYSHKRDSPTTFAEDREKDENRSELRIHLMMCEMASLNDMPVLADHALHRALHNVQGKNAAEVVLKSAASIVGIHIISKNDGLRKLFANFIAENQGSLNEDVIRQWIRGDGTFAIEVMECLRQKLLAKEKQIVDMESPPNLKKRRPSIELVKAPTMETRN